MAAKKYKPNELIDWMVKKSTTPGGIRRNIMSNASRGSDVTTIGKLYFFWYSPKHKDKLPMYDRFPLVFPIAPSSDGFLGLNLHYLSSGQRSELLDKLMRFATNKNLTPETRLNVSYDLLNSTRSVQSLMGPCVKRYLFSHMRSHFIEVYPEEWDKAAQLPIDVFVTNPQPRKK